MPDGRRAIVRPERIDCADSTAVGTAASIEPRSSGVGPALFHPVPPTSGGHPLVLGDPDARGGSICWDRPLCGDPKREQPSVLAVVTGDPGKPADPQEYLAKVNSGHRDGVVARDLQPAGDGSANRSSPRNLFEPAFNRLAGAVAAANRSANSAAIAFPAGQLFAREPRIVVAKTVRRPYLSSTALFSVG